MDKIEFKVENRKNGDFEYNSVRIVINNEDLIKLLKDFETPLAKREGSVNVAGGYDGLTSLGLYKSLTDKQAGEKTRILECECGCEGCWPFMTRIVELDGQIIWTDFEQPHRAQESQKFWDYKNFGEFKFDRREFDRQIESLKSISII
jgi:hypothetical protein